MLEHVLCTAPVQSVQATTGILTLRGGRAFRFSLYQHREIHIPSDLDLVSSTSYLLQS
jgi:hypothetical protein